MNNLTERLLNLDESTGFTDLMLERK